MSLGFGQILILLVIILILFGAGKLPKVMKDLAKGTKSFKEGLHEEEEEQKAVPPTIVKRKKTSVKNSTSKKKPSRKAS